MCVWSDYHRMCQTGCTYHNPNAFQPRVFEVMGCHHYRPCDGAKERAKQHGYEFDSRGPQILGNEHVYLCKPGHRNCSFKFDKEGGGHDPLGCDYFKRPPRDKSENLLRGVFINKKFQWPTHFIVEDPKYLERWQNLYMDHTQVYSTTDGNLKQKKVLVEWLKQHEDAQTVQHWEHQQAAYSKGAPLQPAISQADLASAYAQQAVYPQPFMDLISPNTSRSPMPLIGTQPNPPQTNPPQNQPRLGNHPPANPAPRMKHMASSGTLTRQAGVRKVSSRSQLSIAQGTLQHGAAAIASRQQAPDLMCYISSNPNQPSASQQGTQAVRVPQDYTQVNQGVYPQGSSLQGNQLLYQQPHPQGGFLQGNQPAYQQQYQQGNLQQGDQYGVPQPGVQRAVPPPGVQRAAPHPGDQYRVLQPGVQRAVPPEGIQQGFPPQGVQYPVSQQGGQQVQQVNVPYPQGYIDEHGKWRWAPPGSSGGPSGSSGGTYGGGGTQ